MMASRTPKELVEYACVWIRDHYRTFVMLMSFVHGEIDDGNPCVSRGDIYGIARESGLTVSEAREFRRDNTLWSVIARYMVMLNPRLARALHFHKRPIDDLDLVGMWDRIVGKPRLFYASSWMEAKERIKENDITAA